MTTKPREFQLCRLCDGGGEVLHWFVEKSALVAANAEIERLNKIIAQEINENDELGAEYTYVRILKDENEKLKAELERRPSIEQSKIVVETLKDLEDRSKLEAEVYRLRCEVQSKVNDVDLIKFELANNEHAYDVLKAELERIEALREGDLQFLNAAEYEINRLNGAVAGIDHSWQERFDRLKAELAEAKAQTTKMRLACEEEGYPKLAADALKERDELKAEVARLTECLKRANEGFEEFERKFYLVSEELEKAKETITRLEDMRFHNENWKTEYNTLTIELEKTQFRLEGEQNNSSRLSQELEQTKEGNEKAYNRGVTKGVDALQPEIEKLKAELERAKTEKEELKKDTLPGLLAAKEISEDNRWLRANMNLPFDKQKQIQKLELTTESYRSKLSNLIDGMQIKEDTSSEYQLSHLVYVDKGTLKEARAALNDGSET